MEYQATVVVPTYNRPAELARLLSFQRALGHTFPTLVLDGSTDEIGETNRKFCADFRGVEHRKYPSSLHAGLRITEGLRLVKTPFVLLCGDDDFYFPDAVLECVRFLQEHADYSAAIGRIWALRYFPQLPLVRGGVSLRNDLDHGHRFNHDRFIQRSMYYFAYTAIGSIPLFYAVCRTGPTLAAFSHVTDKLKYSSLELVNVGFHLINGKVAKLPIAFGLRDYASVVTRDPEREGATSYFPREDLEYLRPLFVEALMKAEHLPQDLAAYLIDVLLLLWSEDADPVRSMPPSKIGVFMRKVSFCLECIAGRMTPKAMANTVGLPPAIYAALLHTHQQFTARRNA